MMDAVVRVGSEPFGSKFADPIATTKGFAEESLDSYPNDELLHYTRQSPRLVTAVEEAALVLSPSLIVKRIGDSWDHCALDGVLTLERARSIGVRVPVVRHGDLVPDDQRERICYLILERVIGPTLEQVWRNLGWWGTLCAAWQLRTFLRLMRSVTSQTTDGLRSGRTRCPLLDNVAGPILHASPTAFVGYLNWWLIEQRRPNSCTPRPDLVLEPARECIFVHRDLAPRNLIWDSHGKLWLVDWGNAGSFPAYMEYFGIDYVRGRPLPRFRERSWSAWLGRLRWSFFRWVAAGSASQYKKHWEAFGIGGFPIQRFRLDRTPFSNPP